MAASRQVRRANERRAAKVAKAHGEYPFSIAKPFQPRGQNWRGWPDLGKQEAARRLRRMEG